MSNDQMKILPTFLAGIAVLVTSFLSPAAEKPPVVPIPAAEEILKTLKKEHPRLLASEQDFKRLQEEVKEDAHLKKWAQDLHAQAERILQQPPSRYEIPDGLRLLATSRRVLQRVAVLSMAYRLETNAQYVDRAWVELEDAGNFKDWNPRHFLDTAEMTHAFAIGYDWLYQAWKPKQREFLRKALVEKGLKLAVECYRGTARYGGWTRAHHNWNQVCNGGIGMGALAIADEEPALAGEFLHEALISLQLPMAYFAPDGAWNEGPGYWNYATTYNIAILAALQTALGTDFGLSKMPGFAEAGMFPIYATGPLGLTFNYADAGQGGIRAPHLFWMATQFNRPEYAAWQLRSMSAPHPLDLLWFRPTSGENKLKALPLDKYFREAEVVTLRSGWDDKNAVFAGLKAGDNKANHSHLDLGSFILDALGVRWAADLGSDDYNLPGYFGKQRWNYYRLRAEGHNTLAINPGSEPDQNPAAMSRITRFESKPERAFAIADLTAAYGTNASKVSRGIALLERRQVLVEDEVQAAQPADVWWFLHTGAEITLSDNSSTAILGQGKARLWAHLLSPAQAVFMVREAQPLPNSPQPLKQAQNSKVRKLAVNVKNATELRLAVLFVPLKEGESAPTKFPELLPLAKW